MTDQGADLLIRAARRAIPSWGLVATQDKAFPPAPERFFHQRAGSRFTEVPGASHVPMISQKSRSMRDGRPAPCYRVGGRCGERSTSRVISLGAKTRKGGPQKPVPRLV